MKTFETRESISKWRDSLGVNAKLGLVPTMGALHAGHLRLVKTAQKDCDQVVVSIFVNPTQFGPTEDLGKYPRHLEQDLQLLESEGVNAVFAPASATEIYPRTSETSVKARPGLVDKMEGIFRPGHFDGVVQVVSKLINIVRPQYAYFGEKDFQQLRVIEAMVEDLFMDVRIRVVETKREASGLAMSSRNQYLSADEKAEAALLYHCLRTCETPEEAKQKLIKAGFDIQYLECWSQNLEKRQESSGRWCAAALFKGVRLIDNIDRSTKSV